MRARAHVGPAPREEADGGRLCLARARRARAHTKQTAPQEWVGSWHVAALDGACLGQATGSVLFFWPVFPAAQA
jgi:hypothetical protein